MDDCASAVTEMNSRLLSRLKIMGLVFLLMQALLFFVALSSARLSPFANGIMLMLYGALFIYYIVTGLAALKGVRSSTDSMSVFVKILLLIAGLCSVLSLVLFMLMEDVSVVMSTISMILALASWAMILFVMFFYTGGGSQEDGGVVEAAANNPVLIAALPGGGATTKGLSGLLNRIMGGKGR